mgnify:CR=1 FL=1
MKKNLMSVLILALVLVNLILTGILTITILPQTKKSNELVQLIWSWRVGMELSLPAFQWTRLRPIKLKMP